MINVEKQKCFYNTGTEYILADVPYKDRVPNLPAGVYSLTATVKMGVIGPATFEKKPQSFVGGGVLFGKKPNRQLVKVVDKYKESQRHVGAMFVGDKGSGKTFTVNQICKKMLEDGYPVILVDKVPVSTIKDAIVNTEQAVFVFDEFGKNYKKSEQKQLLSELDGFNNNLQSKKLFLFTENSITGINSYIRSRPSRVHFSFMYGKLDEDVIVDYCHHRGITQNNIDELITRYRKCVKFSFDDLQAIVNDILLFPDDSVKDIIDDINCNALAVNKTLYVGKVVGVLDSGYSPINYKVKYSKHNDTEITRSTFLTHNPEEARFTFGIFSTNIDKTRLYDPYTYHKLTDDKGWLKCNSVLSLDGVNFSKDQDTEDNKSYVMGLQPDTPFHETDYTVIATSVNKTSTISEQYTSMTVDDEEIILDISSVNCILDSLETPLPELKNGTYQIYSCFGVFIIMEVREFSFSK